MAESAEVLNYKASGEDAAEFKPDLSFIYALQFFGVFYVPGIEKRFNFNRRVLVGRKLDHASAFLAQPVPSQNKQGDSEVKAAAPV